MNSRNRKWIIYTLIYLFVAILSVYVAMMYLFQDLQHAPMVKAKLKEATFPFMMWKICFYPHLTLGLVAYITGAVQLTTRLGVWHIVKRNIPMHRAWILRSYAITWVFVSFRLVVAIISMIWHAPNGVTFPIAVYLSIVGNLLLTELYLQVSRRKASPSSFQTTVH
ncbi:DUF2306 domain-containing protein [Paenibacillus sp. GCM10027628]|uniref:DUF2306 domain-containing protein n=1 Tax=Paenibacillus sp. GCM10027628 TaxID=3273413 RepID=UPI00363784AD